MAKARFTPFRGTEEKIKQCNKIDGRLYFATDSGKIYLDIVNERKLMGGSSAGIIYANGTEESIIQDEFDESSYTMSVDILEKYDKLEENYLIINSDGRFFRIKHIEDGIITATLLAVSGSGGGGGGGNYSYVFINDVDENTTKYYTIDNTDATINFICSSSVEENNRIESITYNLGNGIIITDNTPHSLKQPISFKIGDYLDKLSTNRTNSLKITVEDAYQSTKSIVYYINVVELTLDSNFNSIYKVNKGNELIYFCTPRGGGRLNNRELQIKIYAEDNPYLPLKEITQVIQSSGVEQTKTISTNDLAHGNYRMTAQVVGTLTSGATNISIVSNILSYSIIVFDETNNSPVFTAITPNTTIEQYSNVSIQYMLATNGAIETSEIIRRINNSETTLSINNNVINYWNLSFDSVGTYDLELRYNDNVFIKFPTITVIPYSGDAPVVDESLDSLKINLKVDNRSNDEVGRNQWNYGSYSAALTDFKWGNVNGWTRDADGVECLKLTSGAKLELTNYYPFDKDAGESGKTIELDFKVSGVTDYSVPLISCLSYSRTGEIFNGIRVTGQESTLNSNNIHTASATIVEVDDDSDESEIIYNTRIQALTSRFVENERIHVSYVIEKKTGTTIKPLVRTYLNGVLSGITEYDNEDYFKDSNQSPGKLIADSTYGDIYLYNIRIYDSALDNRIILNNYLATLPVLFNRIAQADWNNVVDDAGNISLDLIEREGYNLKVPYILLTGGHAGTKSAGYQTGNDYHLPYTKKDYRLMSIEYHDPNDIEKNFIDNLHFVDNFGNSTYDINEVDSSYSADSGALVYGQGTSSMEYPVKNLRIKLLNRKFQVYKNGYPVNLLCFKADYMESSGSHNTGTGNLVYDLYNNLGYKTPAQTFYENLSDPDYNYKYLTAIKGYPVVIFYRENENQDYEFVGKYNLNLDKATQEPFGFFDYDKDGKKFGLDENGNNTIFCVEWLNNASPLCNFLNGSSEMSIEDYFTANWEDSFEGRYPDGEDLSTVDSFKNLIAWVNSTNTKAATGNSITPVIYGNEEFTEDTAEYRLAKFKAEVWNYLNKDFTLFYYVLTHILLMIDSRAKNMMMATWDNQHWYPIFYDMDTMLGLNNYGYNKYNYDVEDSTGGIYNGENSVLWNNIKECFATDIASTYALMRNNGLTYENLVNTYNDGQADAWNEALYNADAYYKYTRPYVSGYWNGISGSPVWVEPYNKSYLYAAQGRRSFHREWWLSNRLNYFDGKYHSDGFMGDRIALRIYSLSNATDPKEIASRAAVTPNADFDLTPFKNGYLGVAYGGQNGYLSGPTYTTANTPLTIHPNPGDTPNDTETYICGASQLQDIGDLSAKYMGNFDLSNTVSCKLTRLILGNHNPQYYNKNLTIANIGTATPFLEEIDITNTQLTNLDLSYCSRIQKVLAAGSKLTGISLPAYSAIEELRLPPTIGSLTLDNQSLLTNFTVGNLEINNDIENYVEANSYDLNTLIVKNTPINSYKLVKDSPELQRYLLTDVNWYITEDPSIEDNEISVLEKLRTLEVADNSVPASLALTGTLTIGIDNVDIDAYEIYNKYHSIYPNLIIQYDTENHPTMNLADVINITFTNYSGSTQTFAVLPKDILDLRRTQEVYDAILDEVQAPETYSTISTTYTFKNVWKFNNGEDYAKTEIAELLTTLNQDAIFVPQFEESVRKYHIIFYANEEGTEVLSESNIEYNNNIFAPTDIPYKDDNGLALTETYRFKGFTNIKGSSTVVDLDEIQAIRDWEFFPVFRVQSVYDEVSNLDWFNFVPYDYKDNVLPSDLVDSSYDANGYAVSLKSGLNISGKITLPSYYGEGTNRKPVVCISSTIATGNENVGWPKSGENITHIFWKQSAQEPCKLRIVDDRAFESAVNEPIALQYIELPDGLRIVARNAFFCTGNINTLTSEINGMPLMNEINLPSSLVMIRANAFNGAFGEAVDKIKIPSNLAVWGQGAITGMQSLISLAQVGTKEKGSCLTRSIDEQGTISAINNSFTLYRHNGGKTSNFIFYYKIAGAENLLTSEIILSVDNLQYVQADDYTA